MCDTLLPDSSLYICPMEDKHITIGSRGSKLALWQAHFFKDKLTELGYDTTIKIIKTKGDNIQNIGFSKMEGKGFFTKEIEEELLNKSIDVAVHSMKDLPTNHPEGLVLAGVSYREDPRDLLLINKDAVDSEMSWNLKKGAIVGTSSARRQAQLKDLRPDITIKDLRGNVPTRIDKLRTQGYDAILLAAAGINRLNLELDDISVVSLNPREFIPAPAQGVLAYQTREEDTAMRKIIARLNNEDVARTISVERRVLNKLDGGCQLPLGVYVEKDGYGYHAWAALGKEDGDMKRVKISHSTFKTLADAVYSELMND